MSKHKHYYMLRCVNEQAFVILYQENAPTESEAKKLNVGALYAVGPFRTRHAAEYMGRYGIGNPHLQTVADAERISRIERNNAVSKV